ncbi:MAG TPA: carboxypeptidase-like regulatory domain-containing protein, partial [Blastocatellia bacterium]|nr:carboxypeptidase-like regulatory domain-containing protein [Blastocatellia bacterium]
MKQIKILLAILSLAVVAAGQTNRGGISGTVTDSTGAVVAKATVTITNLGTNQTIKVVTSDAGAFTATSLEPVAYRVTVEAPGFKRAVADNVKVDTANTSEVNFALETGALDNQVSITAETPLLNAESGTVGQTITERQIQDVPLLNRSVLDLAVTLPNVSGDVGSENPGVTAGAPVPGFNLSLDGGRPGSTAILADGVNNTGVGIARAVVTFSPETVQEFTVKTSAYSAEYGRTGGGIINMTTKSGTNRINGTALWYQRNPALNAAPYTTSATNRPPSLLRENQLHFSVGGPIFIPKVYDGHDRTFFFFAVEPRYRQDFLVTDTLLPTDAMRGGDFSNLARVSNGWAPANVVSQFGLVVTGPSIIYQQFNLVGNQLKPITLASGQLYQPFPGNRIPQSMMDPTALKALEFMPHAGSYFIDGSGLLSNYVVNRFVHQNEVRYTTRIDHTIDRNNILSFRYTLLPVVGETGFGSDINGNTASYSHSQQALITETHTFSPTLINEARINYTRGTFSNDFTPEFSIKGGRNLATELGLPSLTSGGMPLLEFLDGPNAFANIGSSGSTNNYNVEERYGLTDIVYWTKGTMSWKFGADIAHELLNVIPFFGASGGRWDFRVVQTSNNRSTQGPAGGNSFASYLMGVSNLALVRPVLIPYYYRWNSGAGFVQNDWKVKPNLTLNLGLRYSLQLPRTEKNNLQGVFMPELAKSFPLSQPITLITGQVVTSALVPPFAYAGRGGRSQYLTPIEWTDFEPRLAFAWSPKLFDRQNTFLIRGGYALSHAPLTGNNRLPNPDFGATTNVTTTATGSSGTVDPTSALRLSSNPPFLKSITPAQALGIPADGLVYLNSLAIPGFALSKNTGVP